MPWTIAVLVLGVVLLLAGILFGGLDPLIGIGVVLIAVGLVTTFTTRNRTQV